MKNVIFAKKGHFFISAPIFEFRLSMERFYQCGLNGVVLLKIDRAVRDINENVFRTKHLKLENRCRNKEMAFYFAKMTFFVHPV